MACREEWVTRDTLLQEWNSLKCRSKVSRCVCTCAWWNQEQCLRITSLTYSRKSLSEHAGTKGCSDNWNVRISFLVVSFWQTFSVSIVRWLCPMPRYNHSCILVVWIRLVHIPGGEWWLYALYNVPLATLLYAYTSYVSWLLDSSCVTQVFYVKVSMPYAGLAM